MKTLIALIGTYITIRNLPFIVGFLTFVIAYNAALIHRDRQLFNAYDHVCAQQQSHPHCRYAK
jgi:hypothetical protein